MSESNQPWDDAVPPPEPQTPAGWYPTGDGWQRYWDGTQWTEHTAAAQGAGPQPVGGAVAPRANSDDTMMALLAHLGGAFLSIVVPIILYAVKRDESPYVRHHSAEAINFHITTLLAGIVSAILIVVVIGFFMLLALFVWFWVMTIVASIAANRGEYYRYPLTLRLVT